MTSFFCWKGGWAIRGWFGQYPKIGENKKWKFSFFFHQRHALSMSLNIFVVTYRVTNFLPKLVDMLLFSTEKNWISVLPVIGCRFCALLIAHCAAVSIFFPLSSFHGSQLFICWAWVSFLRSVQFHFSFELWDEMPIEQPGRSEDSHRQQNHSENRWFPLWGFPRTRLMKSAQTRPTKAIKWSYVCRLYTTALWLR